jgi:hypothetical protein
VKNAHKGLLVEEYFEQQTEYAAPSEFLKEDSEFYSRRAYGGNYTKTLES